MHYFLLHYETMCAIISYNLVTNMEHKPTTQQNRSRAPRRRSRCIQKKHPKQRSQPYI